MYFATGAEELATFGGTFFFRTSRIWEFETISASSVSLAISASSAVSASLAVSGSSTSSVTSATSGSSVFLGSSVTSAVSGSSVTSAVSGSSASSVTSGSSGSGYQKLQFYTLHYGPGLLNLFSVDNQHQTYIDGVSLAYSPGSAKLTYETKFKTQAQTQFKFKLHLSLR